MTQDFLVADAPLMLAGKDYQLADRFDVARLLKQGLLTERIAKSLEEQKKILPLTRDNFRRALDRRPAGAGRPDGFTDEFLIDKGVIDAPLDVAPKALTRGGKPVRNPAPSRIELTSESVQHGDIWRTPFKAGVATIWRLSYADGVIVDSKAYRTAEKAIAAIEALSTKAESSGSPAEAQQESTHGRDVHAAT